VNDLVYLDSSAIIKLIFEEPETESLETFLRTRPQRASSVAARIETLRTARTVDDPGVTRHADRVLARIHLVSLNANLVAQAIAVEPLTLRALDAIHLATALSLQPDLGGMVTYDRRLAASARAAGLTVWAPA